MDRSRVNYSDFEYEVTTLYQETKQSLYGDGKTASSDYVVRYLLVKPNYEGAIPFVVKQIETNQWQDRKPAPTNLLRTVIHEMKDLPHYSIVRLE